MDACRPIAMVHSFINIYIYMDKHTLYIRTLWIVCIPTHFEFLQNSRLAIYFICGWKSHCVDCQWLLLIVNDFSLVLWWGSILNWTRNMHIPLPRHSSYKHGCQKCNATHTHTPEWSVIIPTSTSNVRKSLSLLQESRLGSYVCVIGRLKISAIHSHS